MSVRKRLTYANVMSSIAVFLVLAGGTAFAANQLGKNTVGSKQLKKNAVTSAKIKNGAVTSSKIAKGAVGASAINTSGLTVPNATHAGTADTATNATNATNAGNANTVGGSTIKKFFYAVNSNGAEQTLLSLDGLTLTGSCASGVTALTATTSAPAMIHAGGTYGFPVAFYVEDDTFEAGEPIDLIEEEPDSVQGTFTYTRPDGTVVTGVFSSEEEGFNTFTSCVISGHAIG